MLVLKPSTGGGDAELSSKSPILIMSAGKDPPPHASDHLHSAPSVSGEEDYETLPTHSIYVHLAAGAMAGVGEHCVMYPLDSLKTRMQSLMVCPERACKTALGGLKSMIRREGLSGSMRGVLAVASGSVPAHALYFTLYEKSKYFFTSGQTGYHPVAHGLAGCIATLAHDAVMNPADVVKQRMQMYASPYRGCLECIGSIYKTEGVAAFYRSYLTQTLMNIPMQSTHFMVYEAFQQYFNPKHEYNPLCHCFSGAAAGGLAAAITTPLDVCKTVLNTQEHMLQKVGLLPGAAQCVPGADCPASVRGMRAAGAVIYRHRGLRGFFGGLQARVLFQMPSTAISWSVYEFFKYTLSLDGEQPKCC